MTIARTLLIIAAFICMGSPAYSKDEVKVRGGGHTEFGRLVFDWPSDVRYEAKISGRNLIIKFERSMSTDLTAAVSNLGDYVIGAELSSNDKTVLVKLKRDSTLKTFKNGNSIVVDVVRKKKASQAKKNVKQAPPLGVRKGKHLNYDRLVFDWTYPVTYKLVRKDENLDIKFNRAAKINLADLRAGLGESFSKPKTAISGNNLIFSVQIKKKARIRHFQAGMKVVLDVFRSSNNVKQQKVTKSSTPPIKAAPITPVKRGAGEKPEPGVKIQSNTKSAPVRLLPKEERSQSGERIKKNSAETSVKKKMISESMDKKKRKGEEKETTQIAQKEAIKLNGSKKSKKLPLDPVTLVFEWPEEVTMAAFRRNKFVYLIFGARTQIETAPLQRQSGHLINRFDQVPSVEATIIRVQTKNENINVSKLQSKDNSWLVEFSQSPMQPTSQINFGVKQAGEKGAELVMPFTDDGQLLSFQDPDIGDAIKVVLVGKPGLGIFGERAYPEFQILASAQGIAVEMFDPEIELKKREKEIAIAGPHGLHISDVKLVPSKKEEKITMGTLGPQIMAPTTWKRGDTKVMAEVRQELMGEIIKDSPKRRAKGRIELARFDFANGFGQEALGVLEIVEKTDPKAASTPEFRALKGAALVLSERGLEAQKVLKDPRLDDYQDVALWRGAADHVAGDAKSAGQKFLTGDPTLQIYPLPLKSKLLVKRLDVALVNGQIERAKEWREIILEEMGSYGSSYQARLSFLIGQLYRHELDFDNAVGAYQTTLDSSDQWSKVQAEYDLINLNLQQETIKVSEAIEKLESLRFAWRGDAFERKVLRRLGELYVATGKYRKGLNILKVIVNNFPKRADAAETAQQMRDIFRRLFLEGEADKIPPVKALALYDEFGELTPAGPEGNMMFQKLAERLVSVDLLDKASDVLSHQVKFRLKGEEKALVGMKLALIRLINRDPQGALNALRDSFYPNLSPEVENDRRRIRAKAEFETGKPNDAIALLAGDVSREADLLRSTIYFRESNWGEAGKVYQRLVGDPPAQGQTFANDKARTVLLWAVALKLNRDEEALRQLFKLYAPGMRSSTLAASFEYIAKPAEGSGFDIGSIKKQIGDVDQFQAFMKNYRERLLKEEKKKTGTNKVRAEKPKAEPEGKSLN